MRSVSFVSPALWAGSLMFGGLALAASPPAFGPSVARSPLTQIQLKKDLFGRERGLPDLKLDSYRGAGKELYSRSQQYIAGARVMGAWLQSVKGANGKVLFARGEIFRDPPGSLEAEITALARREQELATRARTQLPQYAKASRAFAPWTSVVFGPDGSPQPRLNLDYIDELETSAWRITLNSLGEPVSHAVVSSGLVDGIGVVFPDGPRSGQPSQVGLKGMTGDGSLASPWIKVYSALQPTAYSRDLLFRYPTEDQRFDEVQVYFYIDRMMSWFKDSFGIQAAHPIYAKAHVGGNGGKSNAAFYFGRQIYLGDGDGVLYRELMRDPSVVFHEVAHAYVDELSGLPSQGEGGALNEGFADFFAAAIADNPAIGHSSYVAGPYRRTLLNNLKAFRDFGDGIYENGSILAATFWDVRRFLGIQRAAELAIRTLIRLGEGGKFVDVAPAMRSAAEGFLTSEETLTMNRVLSDRGWSQN